MGKLENVKKLKDNKLVMFVWNLFYWLLVLLTIATLVITLLQRTSDNTLSLGGFRIFNIVTESMVPKYVIGDVLLSRTIDPNEINVGDDVVYNGEKGTFADKIVTHRVVDIKQGEERRTYFLYTRYCK